MRFDDDPRLPQIVSQTRLLQRLQVQIKATPESSRGRLMLDQASGYERLRDLIGKAGPTWLEEPEERPARSGYVPKAGTLTRKIYEFLRGRIGTPFDARDLGRAFGDPRITNSSLRGRLSFLKARGVIEQCGKGLYRFPDGRQEVTIE